MVVSGVVTTPSQYFMGMHLKSISHKRDLIGVQSVGGFDDFSFQNFLGVSKRPYVPPQNNYLRQDLALIFAQITLDC